MVKKEIKKNKPIVTKAPVESVIPAEVEEVIEEQDSVVPAEVKQKIVDHLNGKRPYGKNDFEELLTYI